MRTTREIESRVVRAPKGGCTSGQKNQESRTLWASWRSPIGLAAVILLASLLSQPVVQAQSSFRLAEKVRHALVTLPYYSVFDNLAFQIVDNGKVVLKGQVTRPSLRSGAEKVVESLEEVTSVVNEVEVLPVSMTDDQLRLATYRAIYYDSVLFTRYATRAIPPIHIIVKDGNVTLIGVVANQSDKDIANILANGVPGAFSVTNSLIVESKEEVS